MRVDLGHLFPVKGDKQGGLNTALQNLSVCSGVRRASSLFPLRRFCFGNRRCIGKKDPPLSTTLFLLVTFTNGVIRGCASSVLAHAFQENTLLLPGNNASPRCTERDLTSLNHQHIK